MPPNVGGPPMPFAPSFGAPYARPNTRAPIVAPPRPRPTPQPQPTTPQPFLGSPQPRSVAPAAAAENLDLPPPEALGIDLSLPPPEALGIDLRAADQPNAGPPPDDGPVDWGLVRRRLESLGAVGFRVDRTANGYQFAFRRADGMIVSGSGATEGAAIRAAFARTERASTVR